jgi:hypothetical protein
MSKTSSTSGADSKNKVAVIPKNTGQGTEQSQLFSGLSPPGGHQPVDCRAPESCVMKHGPQGPFSGIFRLIIK